jgi:protein-tyrosine-phosphatase
MKYLFVCKSNVGRSQMASAMFNGHKGNFSDSAGTHVSQKEGEGLHEYVLEVMQELGFDLRKKRRTQMTLGMVDASDKIIVMLDDHNDLPKYVPLEKVIFWDIPDAKGMSLDFHRKVRDSIKKNIDDLLKDK